MDNQAANRSSEKEDYAENQLQTKQTQEKKAVKQNTVINQTENENNGEEVNKDDSLNGATDSSKKGIDPKKLPRHRHVNMSKARSLLSCEFCQGLMRKANVINPCIHRVCGGCINDCIKLGKKECPVCGTNYSSIVEDGKISRIVAIMFPETEKIEPRPSKLPAKDEACNKKMLINDKNTLYNAKRSRSRATENSSSNNSKRSRSCAKENSSSNNVKRSQSCAMENSSSSMSESVPSPSKSPPELTDEMLDQIGKRVVAAILKQQKRHQQQPPNTNANKKSEPEPEPNQQL